MALAHWTGGNGMATHSALDNLNAIVDRLRDRPHAVCLDYDGTLTPIRPSPPEAVLSEEGRAAIVKLARQCPVAIVTGRALNDARMMVDVDLIYAASHGFELQFPSEAAIAHTPAEPFRAAIAETAASAEAGARDIEGVMIERKPFSTAVHFRLARPEDLPRVHALVAELERQHPDLRVLHGKKVCEFQPRLDWDKGRAVLLVADRLQVPKRGLVYIGDDVTDEDAFNAIAEEGIGILVGETDHGTAARFHLRDPDEVRLFLERLADELARAAPQS